MCNPTPRSVRLANGAAAAKGVCVCSRPACAHIYLLRKIVHLAFASLAGF